MMAKWRVWWRGWLKGIRQRYFPVGRFISFSSLHFPPPFSDGIPSPLRLSLSRSPLAHLFILLLSHLRKISEEWKPLPETRKRTNLMKFQCTLNVTISIAIKNFRHPSPINFPTVRTRSVNFDIESNRVWFCPRRFTKNIIFNIIDNKIMIE